MVAVLGLSPVGFVFAVLGFDVPASSLARMTLPVAAYPELYSWTVLQPDLCGVCCLTIAISSVAREDACRSIPITIIFLAESSLRAPPASRRAWKKHLL